MDKGRIKAASVFCMTLLLVRNFNQVQDPICLETLQALYKK